MCDWNFNIMPDGHGLHHASYIVETKEKTPETMSGIYTLCCLIAQRLNTMNSNRNLN